MMMPGGCMSGAVSVCVGGLSDRAQLLVGALGGVLDGLLNLGRGGETRSNASKQRHGEQQHKSTGEQHTPTMDGQPAHTGG